MASCTTTFYQWRYKLGGMDAFLMACLKAEIIAEAMAKMVTLSVRKEMTTNAVTHHACLIFGVSKGCYRYQLALADELLHIIVSQRGAVPVTYWRVA